MKEIPKITELDGKITGKRVFLRADFNVPVKNGEIEDDFRIRKTLPTISWLVSQGARVIVGSHIWGDETTSLEVVHDYLSRSLPVAFAKDIVSDETREQVEGLQDGEVLLLENLRLWDGEKKCDDAFAEHLASFAEIYINDAFPVSHREHASVVGVPQHLPSYAGLQFIEEVENLSKVFDPSHPFLFILGGAKFETKIPLAEKFIGSADTIYIGGALPSIFYEAQGYEIGKSPAPENPLDISVLQGSESVLLPRDLIVTGEDGEGVKKVDQLDEGDVLSDIGDESMSDLLVEIERAEFVVWNGPMGDYQRGFSETTKRIARALAESGATTIVGGGDTLAALGEMEDVEDQFTFVSTAGGAMLSFLANDGSLPGIEALRR